MPKRSFSALLQAAARQRAHAYAPYSGFRVGAALRAGGRVFAACNVENSAYPLSVCAERNAVAMAVAAGARAIDAVAIVGGEGRPAAPCGGCRQVLAEFCAPEVPVVYASADGEAVETTVGELLPAAFGPRDLKEAAAGSTRTRPAKPTRAAPGTGRSSARARGTRSTGR